ncbi:MAG: glycosyltransferase [Veillonellales bacterium]
MNILIVPSWYPSKNNSSSGSFFREQAIALAKYGHSVIVLNATFAPRSDYFSPENFRYIKRKDGPIIEYSYVVPTFGFGRISRFAYIIFKKNMFMLFDRIKKDNYIDIVHAHSYFPAGLASCSIGLRESIPVVITEHSTGIRNMKMGSIELKNLNKVVEMGDRFICVSENLKSEVIKVTNTRKEIDVIPNMVSSLFFDYMRTDRCKLQKESDDFVFMSIGSLIQRKRFDTLIDAFAMAFKDNKQVVLNIVGDGPLKKELGKKICYYGLKSQIHLLGQVSRNMVAKNISTSNCFVLVSEYETFGVVYIEAMACGKPVIAVKNGGAEGIVKDSNGILVEENNADQLSAAMIYMYKNAERYDSTLISKYCYDKYSEASVCNQLSLLYTSAIDDFKDKHHIGMLKI